MRYLITLLILSSIILISGCDPEEFHVCGDTVFHDGYEYSTVQISDQCWFSENLRYLPVVSPTYLVEGEPGQITEFNGSSTSPYYYVYDYQGTDVEAAKSTDNYETYGVVYNWPAVMTAGICPSGWHIPSHDEFMQLADSLGGSDVAGYFMKSISGWNDDGGDSGNGSNSSGFSGLPGGQITNSDPSSMGNYGKWWSSTEVTSDSRCLRLSNYNDILASQTSSKKSGFSARCVRD
jgi:uncharacterized protein (TIGR02145 family)